MAIDAQRYEDIDTSTPTPEQVDELVSGLQDAYLQVKESSMSQRELLNKLEQLLKKVRKENPEISPFEKQMKVLSKFRAELVDIADAAQKKSDETYQDYIADEIRNLVASQIPQDNGDEVSNAFFASFKSDIESDLQQDEDLKNTGEVGERIIEVILGALYLKVRANIDDIGGDMVRNGIKGLDEGSMESIFAFLKGHKTLLVSSNEELKLAKEAATLVAPELEKRTELQELLHELREDPDPENALPEADVQKIRNEEKEKKTADRAKAGRDFLKKLRMKKDLSQDYSAERSFFEDAKNELLNTRGQLDNDAEVEVQRILDERLDEEDVEAGGVPHRRLIKEKLMTIDSKISRLVKEIRRAIIVHVTVEDIDDEVPEFSEEAAQEKIGGVVALRELIGIDSVKTNTHLRRLFSEGFSVSDNDAQEALELLEDLDAFDVEDSNNGDRPSDSGSKNPEEENTDTPVKQESLADDSETDDKHAEQESPVLDNGDDDEEGNGEEGGEESGGSDDQKPRPSGS